MLKNALFFVKSWKNCRSVGGSGPNPWLASGGWGLCSQTTKLLFLLKLRVIF